MKIVIPGGSGYLGRLLTRHFGTLGHEVVVLAREPSEPGHVRWDPTEIGEWVSALEGADALINLAGRSVNCRYDEDNRREILASRVETTLALGKAVARTGIPVWINSSSATIYRHAEDRPQTESEGEIGTGFSVDVCKKWEQSCMESDAPETRKVLARTAMVFEPGEGGVFEAFYDIVHRGFGGPMGDGRQMVSWIHAKDYCRAIEFLIGSSLTGPVNIASPNPLPNAEFLRVLRREMHTRVALPTTRWMLEVGAQWLGTETELLLKSRWVLPERLLESGFEFCHPFWDEAARDILASY
ncbi:MAG TPA: TIGR01777 family oxidoreductase [Fimbriimonas sp.]